MKRPPRPLLYILTAFLLCAAAPTPLAQYYWSGGGQIALTPIDGQYVVEAASGVDETALAQALGSDFSVLEVLPRDFYVVDAASGLTEGEAESLLDASTSVARYHPDYYVGTGTMRFTITDYVRAGFGPGVTAAQVSGLNAQYGVQTVDSGTFADGSSVYTLGVPAGAAYSTLEVANAYYTDSLTEWAVPDAYADLSLQSEPSFSLAAPSLSPVMPSASFSGGSIDDPLYPNQWHLENTGQSGITPDVDIDADLAWGITTGSASVTAAIVDSGVEDHMDFEPGQRLANGWTAPALGGGDGSPRKGAVHGQNVAGLAAADFNTIGVRGVSEKTRILPIAIQSDVFAPFREIAAAIDTARVRGADVMNHSWGTRFPGVYNDDVAAAFERALEDGRGGKGIVMVAAAGNNGETAGPDFIAFPALLPGVIAVGGVTSENNRGPYSPQVFPSGERRADVVAPSSGGLLFVTTITVDDGYTSNFSKTSAAAPQVAGIATLILAINPDLSVTQVTDLIKQTADYDPSYHPRWAGNGRVNAYQALVQTLELYGGTLAQDVTIPAGETWDLGDVTLAFAPGTRLIVEGTLNADGTTFTERDAGQGWGGIAADGTLDLDDATIEHATVGVTVYDPGTATIANSTIRDNTVGIDVLSNDGTVIAGSTVEQNGTGIRSGIPETIGGGVFCFGACRSTFTLLDSFVNGNTGNGVYAISADAVIQETVMSGNGLSGLRLSDATVDPFDHNILEGNGVAGGFGTNKAGIWVLAGGDLQMKSNNPQPYGVNRVAGNTGSEVAIASGGTAFIGSLGTADDDGRNSIYDDSGVFIANNSGATIYAGNTYWDHVGGPPAGALTGGVIKVGVASDCDYTVSPPECLTASRTSTGTLALSGRDASGTEQQRGERAALRALIRATRAALVADPAAEVAPGLVRTLAALHRRDRDDETGERAASWGQLRSLRARLNNPNLPALLRATAEAALEVEAVELLTRGEHEGARELLALPVEGGGVGRVLSLVEAHLEAGAGRYAEAAALVAAVAAEEAANGEPESGLDEVLLDLASVYAERAGSGERARGAGLEALARGTDAVLPDAAGVSLAAYPNPSAGAATVALTLPRDGEVHLTVYDVLGRRVATLAEGPREAGTHRFGFGGRSLPSGVYLLRAETPGEVLTRRITLLR